MILCYLSFSFGFTSLSVIISSSIYVAANGIISFFLWLSSILLCAYHIFIHSSVFVHVGCFHALAIVNSAAVNIGMQIYVCLEVTATIGLVNNHISYDYNENKRKNSPCDENS